MAALLTLLVWLLLTVELRRPTVATVIVGAFWMVRLGYYIIQLNGA